MCIDTQVWVHIPVAHVEHWTKACRDQRLIKERGRELRRSQPRLTHHNGYTHEKQNLLMHETSINYATPPSAHPCPQHECLCACHLSAAAAAAAAAKEAERLSKILRQQKWRQCWNSQDYQSMLQMLQTVS